MKKRISLAAFCLGTSVLFSAHSAAGRTDFVATRALPQGHTNHNYREDRSKNFTTFNDALNWAINQARTKRDGDFKAASNLMLLKKGRKNGKRFWIYGDNGHKPFAPTVESNSMVNQVINRNLRFRRNNGSIASDVCSMAIIKNNQPNVQAFFNDNYLAIIDYNHNGQTSAALNYYATHRASGLCRGPKSHPHDWDICGNYTNGYKTHQGTMILLPTIKIYEVDHVETEEEKLAKREQTKAEELGENPCNNNGNPINITTGNKYQPFSLPLGNIQLDTSIHYNSLSKVSGVFGKKRTSLLDTNVTFSSNKAKIRLPDGKLLHLRKKNNKWSRAGVSQELVQAGSGWQLVNKTNQQTLHFNNQGKLTTITHFDRTLAQLSYSGDVISTEDEFGTTADFTLHNGLVQSVMAANSDPITLTYDNKQNLTDILFKQNHYQFLFEDTRHPHALTKRLKNGKELGRYSYNDKGQATFSQIGEVTGDAETTTVVNRRTYEFKNDTTTIVTNPLGKKTTYHFKPFHTGNKVEKVEGHKSKNCVAANRNYTYYPNSLVKTQTDWKGNKTSFQYNERGLEVKRVEAEGTKQAKNIYTKWHPTFDLPSTINQGNKTQVLSYNDKGELQSKTTRKKINSDRQINPHDGSVEPEVFVEAPDSTGNPDVSYPRSYTLRHDDWEMICRPEFHVNGTIYKSYDTIELYEGTHIINYRPNCRSSCVTCPAGMASFKGTISGKKLKAGYNTVVINRKGWLSIQ